MNKKGFTLIELLSVVTLIVLISLIVMPNITKNINKKKQEISEVNQKLLTAATDTYIQKNGGKYASTYEANGSTYCIPIQSLINDGILITPFKDVNGNEIDYSDVVKATYEAAYNGFNYELVSKLECTETINYVSRPQLSENMIPVVYEDGAWKKADITTKWYNYSTKKWANAVIVNSESNGNENSKSRDEYKNAPIGTTINEDDILAYFVWIPRYRYKIFNSETPTTIEIVFESVGTPKSRGTTAGEWLTHPAFSLNNKEMPGIWIGKYEASNSNNNIIIKSNQTPWTNINYYDANTAAINMITENNIYGLKDINLHMTRNSEWAAVTYLANSIYGINDTMDSNSTTTGNNTGIYNMVGNKEYVLLDANSVNDLGHSLVETDTWTSNTNTYVDNDNKYLTRGGNNIFNYNKSIINGSNTSFRVSLINTATYVDYKHKYTVTFDPNGGTVSELTKEVVYGDSYGYLPTPTREGYTFKGWNGKNMLELKTTAPYQYNNPQYTVDISNASITIEGTLHAFVQYYLPALELGKTYSLSGNATPINSNSTTIRIVAERNLDNGNTIILDKTASNGYFSESATIENSNPPSPAIIFFANFGQSGTTGATLSNIQLEEGDTATEYEPYYITSDTKVVQDKNHTLKAIWEANS